MNTTKPAVIHLICGSTGAGKTTYAHALANEVEGICFSIDEWMVRLFGEDAPENLTPAWFVPRVSRCETQMWATALQLGERGIPSILDLGFQRYEHRQRFASLIKEAGFSAKMHVLDIDASVRWERVQSRNSNPGKTFSMEITRGMFDYIEGIWQRPSRAEMEMMSNT